jgi:hypothetical protein
VVPLKGTGSSGITATYSRTPEEANAANGDPGLAPPPFPSQVVNGQNQFIRLQFPVAIQPSSVLDPDNPDEFFLNGNIEITGKNGKPIKGLATVGGKNAQGVDVTTLPGWPVEPNSSGIDRNAQPGAFVYVALGANDNPVTTDLEPPVAFGGSKQDSDGDPSTTDIKQMIVHVHSVNGITFDAFYTINVGTPDTNPPAVVDIVAKNPVPGEPTIDDLPSADVNSSFQLTMNEPMTPQSVGLSARLNAQTFNGNIPNLSGGIPPVLPNVSITSTLNKNLSPLFIPFDCNPINTNNLSGYIIRPLIPLPPNAEIKIVVRDLTTNTQAAFDLRGNQVAIPKVQKFKTGDGSPVVNAPVSPEVVYWLSGSERGMGAIDLNGFGFNTNKPNAHGDPSLPPEAQPPDQLVFTSILTRVARPSDTPPFPGYNPVTGQARKGNNNKYFYPAGTGSQALAYQTRPNDPGFPGNPGTPIPGINEKSDGQETLVKNSEGSVNLTGGVTGTVGAVTDCEIGDSLDRVYFDTQNFWAQNSASRTSFDPLTALLVVDKNNIGDPPVPNPPPLRYEIGLQPVGFVLDLSSPTDPVAFLIEGEEVFMGIGSPIIPASSGSGFSKLMLIPNQTDPLFGPDQLPKPFYDNGPPPQTATAGRPFAARQQIGNFLYCCDQTSKQLKVLNSNTFRVITTIDLPDPWGVGIMPHLKQIYVSNFGDNSVSVVGTDPSLPGFHEELVRIPVGQGPRAISCQVDAEDVLVGNWVGDTMDIINPGTNTVRKTITALINKPYEIVTSERQTLPYQGFMSGIYFAYISNFGGNGVVVFESGPDGPFGIGLDNIRGEVPNDAGQNDIQIIEPRGMTYDPGINPEGVFAGGVYVAHRDEQTHPIISRVQFTHQPIFGPIIINPPPGFFQPPGFSDRRFEVTSQWGTSSQFKLSGNLPSDVALSDLELKTYATQPTGGANYGALNVTTGLYSGIVGSKHTWRVTIPFVQGIRAVFPDHLYAAYSDTGTIDVLDPQLGNTRIKAIPGATDSVTNLIHYWSQ